MTALPLVGRELQAEARRSFNYWLRVLGAGSVVVAFTLTSLNLQVDPARYGPLLFLALNTALSAAIWILVPVLTADCISREKREGTLGLLFLTPLTARNIVMGKMVIHGLRAATLVLSALPLLALPLILGGVAWQWAVQWLLFHLAALLLALTAGLIASVRNTEWTRTLVTAEFISAGFAAVFGGFGFIFWRYNLWTVLWGAVLVALVSRLRNDFTGALVSSSPPVSHSPNWFQAQLRWAALPALVRRRPAWVWTLSALGFGLICYYSYDLMRLAWTWTDLDRLVAAIAIMLIAGETCSRQLRESWQRELTAPPQPAWVKIFSTSEFWQSLFRWNKSRTLDRNPVAWLQEYSWTARLTKWGWCILMLLGQFYAFAAWSGFMTAQSYLNLVLILGLAFSASGSFRRERQTGALELLLVSPLQAWQLIGGRVWGVWCHFLPAASILYCCWLMAPENRNLLSWSWLFLGLSSFLLLPVIGLYFSLLRLNFLVAWLATCATGLGLPWLAVILLDRWQIGTEAGVSILCVVQVLAALVAGQQLYQKLDRRAFFYQQVTT